MEVILRQAVENLGKPGEVVKVSNGYGRNFLLPRGVAFEATPGNLKRIQLERDRLEAAENDRRSAAQQHPPPGGAAACREARAGFADLLGACWRRGQAVRLGDRRRYRAAARGPG